MIKVVSIKSPEWNTGEILRYAKAKGDDASVLALMRECMAEAEPELSYKVSYTVLDIKRAEDHILLGELKISSDTLRKALKNADKALLFAATVGSPFDRLIQRYSRLSPSKALMLQAVGAERVEALCDSFCDSICADLGCSLLPRVSPGYGDISMKMQRDIFAVLDCPRKIGLTLSESLLMSPSKSVTAIAGIVPSTQRHRITDKCDSCEKTDCEYRTQR